MAEIVWIGVLDETAWREARRQPTIGIKTFLFDSLPSHFSNGRRMNL